MCVCALCVRFQFVCVATALGGLALGWAVYDVAFAMWQEQQLSPHPHVDGSSVHLWLVVLFSGLVGTSCQQECLTIVGWVLV